MPPANSDRPVQVGDWNVEPAADAISRDGVTVKLEPRTMRLLMFLVESGGAVVSIERLLSEVWTGVIVSPASVYQAVSQLRKVLGDTDPEPTYIATVPRKGYRLVAAVRPVDPPPAGMLASGSTLLASEASVSGSATLTALAPRVAPAPSVGRSYRWWGATLAIAGIAIVGFFALRNRLAAEAPAPSIVVLPFLDLTAGKQDQPFCDGLTEELSNWLAQIPSLRVVARTSAFSFRGRDEDVRKIGKSLDTNHVLEGSMRRSGDHMRVTVQLIDARTGYHLWSATYDRQMADTIRMQEEISRSVAENLELRLTPATARRFIARRSTSPQAYQWYLVARYYQQQRTAQSNEQAIQLYRRILTEDPKFPLAYVGLAYALLNENWLGDRPIGEIAAEAEPLLETAVTLDSDLSDIYAVRGALRAEQFKIDLALQDFARAVALNPNDSLAFAERGRLYLIEKGQPRDALDNYTKAAALNPLDSLPHAQRCVTLQDLGKFAEAEEACARSRALQPQGYWPLEVTGWLEAARGRLDEALLWNEKALATAPDVFVLYSERALWLLTLGLPERARETLEMGRVATKQEEAVNDGLSGVAYYEGGAPALKAHLAATRLEGSPHAQQLLSAAYYRLLTGEAPAAKSLVERAFKATDFIPAMLDSPWEAARGGHSDELTVALVELRNGGKISGMRRLNSLSATLDHLAHNGEKRFGVDELRATVLALHGDGDAAMRALARAADVGWRRSWWAQREPDVEALWNRGDFRALIARVDGSNAQMRSRVVRGQR